MKTQIEKAGIKFIKILNIPLPKRDATLQRLAALLSLAKKLPESDEQVKDARKALSEAIDGILNCGSKKGDRRTLLTEAGKLCDELGEKLNEKRKQREQEQEQQQQQLESSVFGLGGNASPEMLKNERKAAQERRKVLLEQIQALKTRLANHGEVFAAIWLPQPTPGEDALLVRIDGLRVTLDEEILTSKRGFDVAGLIKAVEQEIDDTVEKHKKAIEEVTLIRSGFEALSQDNRFRATREAFASEDDFAASDLGHRVDGVRSDLSIPPSVAPIPYLRLVNQWERLQAELDVAAKDPESYAKQAVTDGIEESGGNRPANETSSATEDKSSELQNRFDSAVADKLVELKAAIEPLGLSTDVLQRRDALRKEIEKEEDVDNAAEALIEAIDKQIDQAGKAFVAMTEDYADLKTRLEAQRKDLASTRKQTSFASDWIRLDAMFDAFGQAAPKDGTKPDRQICQDVAAALKLGRALWQQQDALHVMKDAAGAFADASKRVKEDLADKNRAGKGSLLVEYFPEFRKEKADQFAKLTKNVKKLGAKPAFDAIWELERELDKKIEEAKANRDEINKSATLEWSKKVLLTDGSGDFLDTLVWAPITSILAGSSWHDNAQIYAYNAVIDAIKSRPVDMTTVRNKEAIFRKTIDGIESPSDLKKATEATAELRKVHLEWAKALRESVREKSERFNVRYGFLGSRLFNAKAEARDANAVKQADLMQKMCKIRISNFGSDMQKLIDRAFQDRAIEAVLQDKAGKDDKEPFDAIEKGLLEAIATAEDGVRAVLDRFSTCVDGLELRPEGQRAAKLKELPKQVSQWTDLLSRANVQIHDMSATLGKYVAALDDQSYKSKVEGLCEELERYADMVAAPTNSLRSAALALVDTENVPEDARRKARETALGVIAARRAVIQGHPVSKILLERPHAFDDVCLLPKRMYDQLATLEFTILTSI